MYNAEIITQFKTVGNKKNQIEIPEDLMTFNSEFLFNFIKVFIELNKKTVGKIIGNNVGK